jgi:hypothetical protein
LSVEACVVVVDRDGAVISIVNDGRVHACDSGVVGEVSALPGSAFISSSAVAEAVVDSAVEAYLLAPIAIVETIKSAFIAPIGRSPQHARGRGRDPDARHPVITCVAISPIGWLPQISIDGTRRLFIDPQHRGRDGNGKKYSGRRYGGSGQHQ